MAQAGRRVAMCGALLLAVCGLAAAARDTTEPVWLVPDDDYSEPMQADRQEPFSEYHEMKKFIEDKFSLLTALHLRPNFATLFRQTERLVKAFVKLNSRVDALHTKLEDIKECTTTQPAIVKEDERLDLLDSKMETLEQTIARLETTQQVTSHSNHMDTNRITSILEHLTSKIDELQESHNKIAKNNSMDHFMEKATVDITQPIQKMDHKLQKLHDRLENLENVQQTIVSNFENLPKISQGNSKLPLLHHCEDYFKNVTSNILEKVQYYTDVLNNSQEIANSRLHRDLKHINNMITEIHNHTKKAQSWEVNSHERITSLLSVIEHKVNSIQNSTQAITRIHEYLLISMPVLIKQTGILPEMADLVEDLPLIVADPFHKIESMLENIQNVTNHHKTSSKSIEIIESPTVTSGLNIIEKKLDIILKEMEYLKGNKQKPVNRTNLLTMNASEFYLYLTEGLTNDKAVSTNDFSSDESKLNKSYESLSFMTEETILNLFILKSILQLDSKFDILLDIQQNSSLSSLILNKLQTLDSKVPSNSEPEFLLSADKISNFDRNMLIRIDQTLNMTSDKLDYLTAMSEIGQSTEADNFGILSQSLLQIQNSIEDLQTNITLFKCDDNDDDAMLSEFLKADNENINNNSNKESEQIHSEGTSKMEQILAILSHLESKIDHVQDGLFKDPLIIDEIKSKSTDSEHSKLQVNLSPSLTKDNQDEVKEVPEGDKPHHNDKTISDLLSLPLGDVQYQDKNTSLVLSHLDHMIKLLHKILHEISFDRNVKDSISIAESILNNKKGHSGKHNVEHQLKKVINDVEWLRTAISGNSPFRPLDNEVLLTSFNDILFKQNNMTEKLEMLNAKVDLLNNDSLLKVMTLMEISNRSAIKSERGWDALTISLLNSINDKMIALTSDDNKIVPFIEKKMEDLENKLDPVFGVVSHLETLKSDLITSSSYHDDEYNTILWSRITKTLEVVNDLQKTLEGKLDKLQSTFEQNLDEGIIQIIDILGDNKQRLRQVTENFMQQQTDNLLKLKESMSALLAKGFENLHFMYQFLSGKMDKIHHIAARNLEDCADIYKAGHTLSGIYTIYPRNSKEIRVYCDMESDEGGWTVIQRRGDYGTDHVNFNQSWHGYKYGFGNLEQEFWIGNEYLHTITNQGDYILHIELIYAEPESTLPRWKRKFWHDLKNGSQLYARYAHFYIGGESQNYTLHHGGYIGIHPYDGLEDRIGTQFSTWDHANDDKLQHCAKIQGGGWWYTQECFRYALNSKYKKNYWEDRNVFTGITWGGTADIALLKQVEMKIIPHSMVNTEIQGQQTTSL